MEVKFKLIATVLLASLLFGWSSTNNDREQGTTVNVTNDQNKLEFGTNISKTEFEELAKNSEFTAEQLQQHLEALIVALKKAKPSQAKGVYVKKVTISTTMGAGVAVDQNTLSTSVA